jgi:glutamine phosphoribosylpyrophosphate amidotransferase
MYAFLGKTHEGFCDACFTGAYPVGTGQENEQRQMRLFNAVERGPAPLRLVKD